MSTTVIAGEADALLREAHDAGYRFPPGFAGFRSDLVVRTAGGEAHGRVEVRAGRRPEIEIELPEEDGRWLEHELSSMAGHRFHRAYEDADGRSGKALADDDGNPLGRLVTIEDTMESSYRVGRGRLNAITRTHGGSRFTIVIQERADAADGRAVSSAFTVCHWDAESGRLMRADAYTDQYSEHDGIFLPTRRRIATASDAGLLVRELELSAHELLTEDES